MVRVVDLKIRGLEYRLTKGDLITNDELAEVVERYGTGTLPDRLRALVVERLRTAPTPRPRGRPKNPNARVARALTIYNNVMIEWARLGGRRGQRNRAIEIAAEKLEIAPETVRDALENDAPDARRRHPSLAFSLRECVDAFARAAAAGEAPEAP